MLGSIALGSLALIASAAQVIQVVFIANALIWTLLGPILFVAAVFPRGVRVSLQAAR